MLKYVIAMIYWTETERFQRHLFWSKILLFMKWNQTTRWLLQYLRWVCDLCTAILNMKIWLCSSSCAMDRSWWLDQYQPAGTPETSLYRIPLLCWANKIAKRGVWSALPVMWHNFGWFQPHAAHVTNIQTHNCSAAHAVGHYTEIPIYVV